MTIIGIIVNSDHSRPGNKAPGEDRLKRSEVKTQKEKYPKKKGQK